MTKQPVIAVEGATKRFGSLTVLDDISLQVEQGKIHGFLGPNGAGKTTAIKIIMDFIRASEGSVSVFGQDVTKTGVEIRARVGFLAGDMELYDNLTGDKYLRYIAHLRGSDDYDHLKKLIKTLDPVLNRPIGTLSRGNQQKIGLLAALMDDPDLLILDEPTTGLDPLMQQKFYAILRDHARRGKTVFMSSHILSEVQEVCDTVTFLRRGQIVETIDVQDLLASTRRRVSLGFNKSATVLDPPAQLQATNIKRAKTLLSFDVTEASRPLMRWIASQPVDDVTIVESSLDTVFIGMYDEGRE